MTELGDFSDYNSESLRVTQRMLRDILTNRNDIPPVLVADLVGMLEVSLIRRQQLALPIGYSPDQIETASKITSSLLTSLNSNEAALNGDKILEILTPRNYNQVMVRQEGMPEIRIGRLKDLVIAELEQKDSLGGDISLGSEMEPDERAVLNADIITSWAENTHLKEYLGRRELRFSMLEEKELRRLIDAGFFGTLGGVMGGSFGAWVGAGVGLYITGSSPMEIHYLYMAIPEVITALGAGGLVGKYTYKEHLAPRIVLSGKGLTYKDYDKDDFKSASAANISQLWDLGDKDGIVKFLAEVNRKQLALDLKSFIQEN